VRLTNAAHSRAQRDRVHYCRCGTVWCVLGNGGRLEYDNSMVVSMEINGLMYHGVLFAQHPHRL